MNYVKRTEEILKKAETYAISTGDTSALIEIAKRWHFLAEAMQRGEVKNFNYK